MQAIHHESPEISIVVPLLNEAESLSELYARTEKALDGKFAFEVIFVDDGSTDASWETILKLKEEHPLRVRGVRFRRNYGKSDALHAGFSRATGKFVVTMDADLQDDPHEIPELIEMLKNGHDLVSGWKKKRHDPIGKTIPSRFFNFMTAKATGIRLHDFNCGLKAYHKEVVDNVKLYGELHRYIPFLAWQQGYTKIGEKVVQHHPRKFGTTKFGFGRFIKGFLDLITLLFLYRYMQRPMHFFGTAGSVFLAAGTVLSAYLAVMRIFYGQFLSNRPMLLLGVLLIVLGVQFFSIGFLGELINKNQSDKSDSRVNIQDIV